MMLRSVQAIAGLVVLGGCQALSCGASWNAETRHRGFKIGVCDWALGEVTGPVGYEAAKWLGGGK
ncbi:MAG: hypothetical protein ACETWQ_17175 [Phycisphaerae bacterium]